MCIRCTLTIINVFSSSRFSGHEKYGPMSPYGDYNKERVNCGCSRGNTPTIKNDRTADYRRPNMVNVSGNNGNIWNFRFRQHSFPTRRSSDLSPKSKKWRNEAFTEMTAASKLLNIRGKIEYLSLLEFQCASDAMSNFFVTTIINVFSSSRFSGHEKYGPMSPYGDYNKERVKIRTLYRLNSQFMRSC